MHAEYLKQDLNLPDPRCDDSIIGATGGLTTGLLTAKLKFGIRNTLFRISSIYCTKQALCQTGRLYKWNILYGILTRGCYTVLLHSKLATGRIRRVGKC